MNNYPSSYATPYGNQPIQGYYGSGYPMRTSMLPLNTPLLSKANVFFDGLSQFTQSISGVASFLDSTLYALLSSIAAFATASQTILQLKKDLKMRIEALLGRLWQIIQRILLRRRKERSRDMEEFDKIFTKSETTIPDVYSRKYSWLLQTTKLFALVSFMAIILESFQRKSYNALILYDLDLSHEAILKVKKSEIIKVELIKNDPNWLRGRKEDGREGLLPSNYVRIL